MRTNLLICITFVANANAWLPPSTLIQTARTKVLSGTSPWEFGSSLPTRSRPILWMNENYDNDGIDQRKQRRFGQLGGRKQRKKRNSAENKKQGGSFPWFSIPALLLAFFLLKGFSWSDPSFVYYESSVYESRVYNSAGNAETLRKVFYRSNIPSLVEQKPQLQQLPSAEDEILQEMDQMMRRQEAFLDEFF